MATNYNTLQQQELIQAFHSELSEKIKEINSHWENIKKRKSDERPFNLVFGYMINLRVKRSVSFTNHLTIPF